MSQVSTQEFATMAEALKKMALEAFGHEVTFDANGAAWLDEYIGSASAAGFFTPEQRKTFIPVMGAFLGECIRIQHGGEWALDEQRNEHVVRLPSGINVYPISKVQKRLDNGMNDSTYALFASIAPVQDQVTSTLDKSRADSKSRPWWRPW